MFRVTLNGPTNSGVAQNGYVNGIAYMFSLYLKLFFLATQNLKKLIYFDLQYGLSFTDGMANCKEIVSLDLFTLFLYHK